MTEIDPDITRPLRSGPCSQVQLETPVFQAWLERMGESHLAMHRKGWEHAYIAQALAERDLLRPGRRGLGFAVGREGLPALFANLGCDVMATDLSPDDTTSAQWAETGQHASGVDAVNFRGIVAPEVLRSRVSFRAVDMRAIPADLRGFDFVWSSCSLEHLGTIGRGLRFILDALECVRPGGFAVHTTEFNLSSNRWTLPATRCCSGAATSRDSPGDCVPPGTRSNSTSPSGTAGPSASWIARPTAPMCTCVCGSGGSTAPRSV
jgi:SAM-dependent methyltransferase